MLIKYAQCITAAVLMSAAWIFLSNYIVNFYVPVREVRVLGRTLCFFWLVVGIKMFVALVLSFSDHGDSDDESVVKIYAVGVIWFSMGNIVLLIFKYVVERCL